MAENYDVIVIGTGAGTLARHLAPVGQAHPAARTRRLAAPRQVENLYLADTSIFPSISAVNPALTAMANAIRVGDRILERIG